MERNPANMVNLCADNLIEVALKGEKQNKEYARKNIREWLNSYTKDTEVGVILLNTNFHISYIPSKVWDTPWLRLDKTEPQLIDFNPENWAWMYVKAHNLDIEPYEIAIEEARKCGVEVWFSIRMNEFHFINKEEYLSAGLWVERPDLRISLSEPFDYEQKEVRDYYLSYIKELCENWDIDGIEIDMWRGDKYFKPPINQKKTQILTDFIKEIRREVDEIAAKRKRRIRISARTDTHPALAAQKGWDSASWVANGSIDVLTISNFFVPTTYEAEVESWRELISQKGGKRENYLLNVGAESYAFCIEYNFKDCRWKTCDTNDLKGFAAMHIDKGADGVYTYNITNRDYMYPKEKRIVDFSEIMSKSAIYKGKRNHILTNDYQTEGGYKRHLPTHLEKGETADFELHTSKVPSCGTYTVILGTEQKKQSVDVFLNGEKCRYTGRLEGAVFNENGNISVRETSQAARGMGKYELTHLKSANDGMNDITVKCNGDAVDITWLEVKIESL